MASESRPQALYPLETDDPWGLGHDRKPAATPARQNLAPRNVAAVTGRTLVATPDATPAPAVPALPTRPSGARPAPRVSAILTALALSAVLVWAGWLAGTTWSNAAQAAQPLTASDTGRLVVSSHPSGGTVTLDGRVVGTTPLALDVRPGAVSVVVTAPEGGRRETIEATIGPGVTLARHLMFETASR